MILTSVSTSRITELSIRAGIALGRVRRCCAFRVGLATWARGESLRLARSFIIAIRVFTRYAVRARSIVRGRGSLDEALPLRTLQHGLGSAGRGVVGVIPGSWAACGA